MSKRKNDTRHDTTDYADDCCKIAQLSSLLVECDQLLALMSGEVSTNLEKATTVREINQWASIEGLRVSLEAAVVRMRDIAG